MSSNLLEIKVQDTGLRAALRRLEARLDDMSPAFREISEILYDATMENFARGGRPAWAPLAPATIRARSRNGTWPGEILKQSGVLMAAVHPFSTRDAAIISVATPYAEIQQRGGTIEVGRRSGSVSLRMTAGGRLVRQGGAGRAKNLAVFASAKHKRTKRVDYEAGPHSITIPARPYLPITADNELQPEAETGILDALNGYLQAGWDG